MSDFFFDAVQEAIEDKELQKIAHAAKKAYEDFIKKQFAIDKKVELSRD